jgi:Bifunctional DNA primase/polymerase, N-terminal
MMATCQEAPQALPVIDPRAREWADSVSLIPLEPKGKKPLIPWKEFTTRRASREERSEWKKRFPGCNWGLVCGKISGVVALDFDGPEGKALFNEHKVAGTTPVNVTGKGFHGLYQVPDRPLKNGVRIVDGLDIRSDDGYIVCPPSTHPTGMKYQWQLPPWVKPPPPVPDWIWPLVEAKTAKEAAERATVPGIGKGTNADFDEFARQLGLIVPAGGWVCDGVLHRCDAYAPDGTVGRGDGSYKVFPDYPPNGFGQNHHRHPDRMVQWKPDNGNHGARDESVAVETLRSIHPKPLTEPTEEIQVEPVGDVAPVQTTIPETSRLRTFPPEVMTGAAGAFAHLYSSYMEPPKEFFFMSYLTCLGIFLSDTLTIDLEVKPQPRLFTVLLGESGDARKSTAITKTVHFFKEVASDFNVCLGVGSAEGLQKRMEGNKKLLLSIDEFMAFVGKCRIEGSVLLPCINSLFENNYYEAQTKQSAIVLNNVHLSILAASTIPTYEKTWSSQFTDIGFNNRLWLVVGEGNRKFSLPPTIPGESKALARKKLAAVIDHALKNPVLQMEEDARAAYDEWYMARPRSIHGKRLDTYAMRLMSLLTVNDLKPKVDLQTVTNVISLCEHQHHIRQLHDPIDADNAVAKLEEKIRRVLKGKGRVGSRDMKRALHVNQTGLWLYNKALNNLRDEKEIGFDKSLGVYFLQPEGVTDRGKEWTRGHSQKRQG